MGTYHEICCLFYRYVSGYKNRFQNFIKYLREMGDEVYADHVIDEPVHLLNFLPWPKFLISGYCGHYSWRSTRRILWSKSNWIMEVTSRKKQFQSLHPGIWIPGTCIAVMWENSEDAIYTNVSRFYGKKKDDTNLSSLIFSFPCPWYKKVPLSLALSPKIVSEVAKFKPDIIHASSPGVMVAYYCCMFFI